MKCILACLSFFFIAISSLSTAHGQGGLKYARETSFYSGNNDPSFLLADRPVTNREYILYLLWLESVYGEDNPDVFFAAFPGLHLDKKKIY